MEYKYKVTRETANGVVTVETNDHSLVMDLCELPVKKVEVKVANESIDTDWQTILQKIKEGENQGKGIVPMTPNNDHITPMTPGTGTNPYPWQVNPSSGEDWFKRPYTVTC